MAPRTKERARREDQWVHAAPAETKRLSIDIPEQLYRAVKVGVAMQGVSIIDAVTRLLEEEFGGYKK